MQDIDWGLQALSTIMLLISLYAQKLIGDKNIEGQYLGLVNQVLWVAFAVWVGSYPTIIASILYGMIYYRNILKWRKGS